MRNAHCAAIVSVLLLAGIAPGRAQVVRQLSDTRRDEVGLPALDDAGSVIYAVSTADPFGSNPTQAHQIVKWTMPGGAGMQVGSFQRGVDSVSVTDDGQRLVFISRDDPLGTNHDQSAELFSMNADGTGLVQLTSDPAVNGGNVLEAMVSGSGNRIAFLAPTDPLGTNPDHRVQLFVLTTATLAVVQLTSGDTGDCQGVSISDDGGRIVFSCSGDLTGGNPDLHWEVFKIRSDGVGLAQVSSSAAGGSLHPVISGNGAMIAFGGVTWVPYSGGATVHFVGGTPTIDDLGRNIYFSNRDTDNNYELWVYNTVTRVTTQLTNTPWPVQSSTPIVSGSNTRLAFRVSGGAYPGWSNPEGSTELMTMTASGSGVVQLTSNTLAEDVLDAAVSGDGGRVVFSRDFSPIQFNHDLFRVESDGSALTALTGGLGLVYPSPDVSGDGQTIVFVSSEDFTGGNSCGALQVFRIHADGTGLIQLTPPGNCPFETARPRISADGSLVVFQSTGDLTGTDPDADFELFAVSTAGGPITQITNDNNNYYKLHSLSADGQWVSYTSISNFDGLNPDGSYEILRARVDGTVAQRVTTYGAWLPAISGDGRWVAYLSGGDPVGTNADHSSEVFLFDSADGTTRQVTQGTDGWTDDPQLSADARFVYFFSNLPIFGPTVEPRSELYRYTVGSGTIERAGGLLRGSLGYDGGWDSHDLTVSADGLRVAVTGCADAAGVNADGSAEAFIVDYTRPSRIEVGKPAPTVLSWEPEPRPVRYDVIRGDVANLQPGAGGAVDLGAVVCLEDDSPDATTAGFGDAAQPVPGQAFFFVHRGTQGLSDGPGSWGQGTGGAERTAGAGACAP
ncbi:MAG TPA: hypothetical protein VJS92_17780 [Candidatus Polarisedimenticolaceae bacterium]|nr:hypothetical protein [Candidatus Polarisedimenticolaceae bacterium]